MCWTTTTTNAAFNAIARCDPFAPLPPPRRETYNCSLDGSRWPYLVQAPEGRPAAILIYLHGHFGDEYQGMTEGDYGDSFGRLRRECRDRGWAYICAWYGGNSWMGPVAEVGLADLIARLREQWPDQPLYLAGASMGGASALVFARRRPELLGGVAAFCPAADIARFGAQVLAAGDCTMSSVSAAIRLHFTAGGADLATELTRRSVLSHPEALTMPVYLSHGTADTLVPIKPTALLADRLRELGRRVQYVEIPGDGHDAPLVQADWPAVLDFLSGA